MNEHSLNHRDLIPELGAPMLRPVTRHSNRRAPAPGHVIVPAAAIGGLSLALVIGLEALGLLGSINQWIAGVLSRGGQETFPHHLPAWCLWVAAAAFPFFLAFAMLSTPGRMRRAVLWLATMVLLGTWGPVLSLAAHAPAIAGPWIATFWAGFCAMIYTTRHLMPADASRPTKPR